MGVLNINVGILGHVDSGKTSLVKALSTVLSTASLDKHPQSRERGITLDLGFSAFTVELPEHLPRDQYSHLQFTLVDCPGHASLIRTIIGGAQIMDMMLLVVDATKGMQAQTTECVVIGEAVMANGADVIVVLNKVDLIPQEERAEKLRLAEEDVAAQLAGTKLSNASFVSCAAAVGGERTAAASTSQASSQKSKGKNTKKTARSGSEKGMGDGSGSGSGHDKDAGVGVSGGDEVVEPGKGGPTTCWGEETATIGVGAVAEELSRRARIPCRRASAPLYFAFDHCFSVRGQGTILTGTVLTGEVKVNEMVELPAFRLQKTFKVKSMQMFRKPVSIAKAGDRVGVCVAGLDAKLMERGVVTTPGSVRPISAAMALVRKVPAFSGQCLSGAYCHVSLGHTTAMATATFFGASELNNESLAVFDRSMNSKNAAAALRDDAKGRRLTLDEVASLPFPWETAFVQQARLVGGAINIYDGGPLAGDAPGPLSGDTSADGRGCDASDEAHGDLQYCHLAFHTPVLAPPRSVVLGSRLDSISSPTGSAPLAHSLEGGAGRGSAAPERCRIAFHGRLVSLSPEVEEARKAPSDVAANIEFGTQPGQLKLFTEKFKTGVVFRVGADGQAGDEVEVFGKDLLKKETNMSPFLGMLLITEDGCIGHLESAFGKAGRFKARFPAGSSIKVGDKLILKFRKYFRDPSKHMHQGYLRDTLERQTKRHQVQAIQEGAASKLDDGAPSPTGKRGGGGETTASGARAREQWLPSREGIVDSVKEGAGDPETVVAFVSGLFSQEEDIRAVAKMGMAVRTEAGLVGRLKGPFGKLGKCKVEFASEADRPLRAGDQVFAPR